MTAIPCFDQISSAGIYPISITLRNDGQATVGTVRLRPENYADDTRTFDYPVSLPANAVKQFDVYPELPTYTSSVDISFVSPKSSQLERLDIQQFYDSRDTVVTVGSIGTDSGLFQSIRSDSNSEPSLSNVHRGAHVIFRDSYCLPSSAPDHAVGYRGLDILAIGDGTDQLQPGQWAAIAEWVTSGGSLLIMGGETGENLLKNNEAAAVSPEIDCRQINVGALSLPANYSSGTFNAVPLLVGQIKPGAYVQLATRQTPLIVSRKFGAGLVTLVAFDPTTTPFAGSSQEATVLRELLLHCESPLAPDSLRQWVFTRSLKVNDYSNAVSFNPFHVKPPSYWTVAWILALYFFAAMPLSYFVLTKTAKQDWAWLYAPAVSLVFAVVFSLLTVRLDTVGTVHRTAGLVTLSSNNPQGHFIGYSEFFTPDAGTYDIVVPMAENLEESEMFADTYGNYNGTYEARTLTTTDDYDGIEVKMLNIQNLSYRRFYFSRPYHMSGSLVCHLNTTSNGIAGQVINDTSLALTNVQVTDTSRNISTLVGSLIPGQAKTVAPKHGGAMPEMFKTALTTADNNRDRSSVYVTAQFSGDQLGIMQGKDISGPSSVTLLMSVPIKNGATSL